MNLNELNLIGYFLLFRRRKQLLTTKRKKIKEIRSSNQEHPSSSTSSQITPPASQYAVHKFSGKKTKIRKSSFINTKSALKDQDPFRKLQVNIRKS